MKSFNGSITGVKVYNRCLSAEEIAQEIVNTQRLRDIRLYISMVGLEGNHFLFGGSDYCGPIVSEFARKVLWLVKEMSQYLDDQEL